VWCLTAVGIRVIVARSFADIYRENCLQNGLLPIELGEDTAKDFERRVLAVDGREPFTVDLENQRIRGPDGADISFDIAATDKMRLIEGLDDIGLTLKQEADIVAWERKAQSQMPWLQRAADRRRGRG
jgi:3-isopropylmalate dehydratase small subunit